MVKKPEAGLHMLCCNMGERERPQLNFWSWKLQSEIDKAQDETNGRLDTEEESIIELEHNNRNYPRRN